MSESERIAVTQPVPGRECGECSVCCVVLTIDCPELQKPSGYPCQNLRPGLGCGIYETRPGRCRQFLCGWRQLKWVRPGLRPDRSGVLVRVYRKEIPDGTPPRDGIIVSLLSMTALKAEGLAETVAAAVKAGLLVYLHVPGPPGYEAPMLRVDDLLAEPVERRDRMAVLDVLRDVRIECRMRGLKPVSLTPR